MTPTRRQAPAVFISSTVEDLRSYRDAVRDAAIEEGYLPLQMEYFESRGDLPPLHVCLEKVDAADVVIVVIAYRFGWVPPDQPSGGSKSITWLECERAVARGKEVLAFVVDRSHPWPVELREEFRPSAALIARDPRAPELVLEVQRNLSGLAAFTEWLDRRGVRATFTTADHLRGRAAHALREWRHRHDVAAPGSGAMTTLSTPPNAEPYLRWLLSRTAYIDIRGCTSAPARLTASTSMTCMWTCRSVAQRRILPRPGERPRPGVPGLEEERPFRLRDLLANSRLVLLGDPGSGKTTLLNRITSTLCRVHLGDDTLRARELGEIEPPFPLLIKLSELAEHIAHSRAMAGRPGPSAGQNPAWLVHFLEQTATENQCPLPATFFESQLQRGSCVLLLDGFDEAPDRMTRASLTQLIESAVKAFEKTPVLITSRPSAYKGDAVLSDFAQGEIEPLSDGAMDLFLDRWCTALYPENASESVSHRDELLLALRERPEIRRMARTPVMLTALAVVHWNERRLPEQRADLYESVITWLARSREQRPHRPSAEAAVGLLSELALQMQWHAGGRLVQISRREAAEAIANEWTQIPELRHRLAAADQFLEAEELDSGIVVRRGSDIRFWHLTFQEFLAARAIAGRPDEEQTRIIRSDGRLDRSEWREVILLLSGLLLKQGRAKVDALIGGILATLPKDANLTASSKIAGLVGSIAQDLSPSGYVAKAPRYEALFADVLAIFDPARGMDVSLSLRLEAALALGRAGDPRLAAVHARRWIEIPTGPFLMGTQRDSQGEPNFDEEAFDNEAPVRRIELGAYRIGRYPLTVAEFQGFVDAGGYADARWWSNGGFGSWTEPDKWAEQRDAPSCPITGVSWFEANAYADWAGCRLPSEAEWERAARGTDGRKFPWGNAMLDSAQVNYRGLTGGVVPVGLFAAAAGVDGVQDMAGQVWEWCQDSVLAAADATLHPETADGLGLHRVVRGGSWRDVVATTLRSAFRCWISPRNRSSSVGFRIVKRA